MQWYYIIIWVNIITITILDIQLLKLCKQNKEYREKNEWQAMKIRTYIDTIEEMRNITK